MGAVCYGSSWGSVFGKRDFRLGVNSGLQGKVQGSVGLESGAAFGGGGKFPFEGEREREKKRMQDQTSLFEMRPLTQERFGPDRIGKGP